MFLRTMMFVIAFTYIVNAAMVPQSEGHMMDNKVKPLATSYFDKTLTAYFRPQQPILVPASSGIQYPFVHHPFANYMQPYPYTPNIQPTVALVPQQSVTVPTTSMLYNPAKPSQIIRTVQRGNHIPILRMASDFNYDGTFNYAYDTGNGISTQAMGTLKNVGQDRQAQIMHGTYSYISPDGTPISTTWYADETGFHAEGAHLPTPPPIPEVIASSLGYIKSVQPTALYYR